jgi:hypothetical protein
MFLRSFPYISMIMYMSSGSIMLMYGIYMYICSMIIGMICLLRINSFQLRNFEINTILFYTIRSFLFHHLTLLQVGLGSNNKDI